MYTAKQGTETSLSTHLEHFHKSMAVAKEVMVGVTPKYFEFF